MDCMTSKPQVIGISLLLIEGRDTRLVYHIWSCHDQSSRIWDIVKLMVLKLSKVLYKDGNLQPSMCCWMTTPIIPHH